jgi:hypothetical protein
MDKLTLGYSVCPFPDYPARRRYEARQVLAKRTAPDEKGYTWSLGYNHLVGFHTGGRRYCRFSGSSYNRSLKEVTYEKDLCTITDDLIRMAAKVAITMSGIAGWAVSEPIRNFFSGPNIDSATKFVVWLRLQMGRDDFDLDLGLHVLSPRSRGKIKDKATAFYRACPGSRVFCTCTFIAPVGDRTGVAILNKFLTAIRDEVKGLQYLWVAERQTKSTNNIHFHIILNKRLPIRRFNALWVLQQYNAGLRGKDKWGQEITMQEVQERYKNGTMGRVLNPLDVKKIYGINGLSSYLTKYITKQEKNVVFDCSTWHCSRGVSRLFTRSTVGPSAFRYCRSFRNGKIDKQTGEIFEVNVIRGQYHILIYINNKKAVLELLREQEQINKWIMGGFRLGSLPMTDDDDYRKYFLCEN